MRDRCPEDPVESSLRLGHVFFSEKIREEKKTTAHKPKPRRGGGAGGGVKAGGAQAGGAGWGRRQRGRRRRGAPVIRRLRASSPPRGAEVPAKRNPRWSEEDKRRLGV